MTNSCQRAALILLSFIAPSVAAMAQNPAPLPATSTLVPITVAVSNAPRNLDPATTTDAAGARLLQLTHPALLRWSTSYQPVGLVAKECRQPTLTTVTCALNPATTFTDGSPVTAPILAQWFRQVQANPLNPFIQLKNVSIMALTSLTLQFTTPSPTLGFLGTLTDIPLANPTSPTVGIGPYYVQGHDTLGTVRLATHQPNLPPLTFVPLSDATTRLLKLKKGEVDAILNDLPPQLVDWARTQGYPVVAVPGTSYSYIGLNLTHPVLSRPEVREALTLGLNRPALRKFLLGGLATPASSLLPPGHPAAWTAPEEPFDPFTAESLLDDAGLLRGPDNTRTTLTLLTSTDPFSQRVSQAIQSELAKLGLTIILRPTEWAAFYDSVKKGNFDMVMLAWTGEQQPAFYYQAFNGTQTPPVGFNRGRLNDAAVNDLTQSIMAATTPATQIQATLHTQQLLAKVRPYIPLYRRHQILVTAPNLTGCTLPPSGAYTGLTTCRRAP